MLKWELEEMMKNKKWLFTMVATTLCLVGCSSPASSTRNTELVFASTRDIRDLNPHLTTGAMAAQNMVFESLVIATENGVEPHLAESWEITEDGLTYTFHLRRDVTFTDGHPFNAYAVKQNIDAVIGNYDRNAWLNLVQKIDYTEVIDDHTFSLTLTAPYYPILEELSLTRPFRMTSPNDFIEETTAHGVSGFHGTGPYMLTAHVEEQYAVFTRNENYWGALPAIESIRWVVLPDHQSIMLGLMNGEIDLVYGSDGDMLDINNFDILESESHFTTFTSEPSGTRAILLNSNRPITGDLNVRLALQYAINRTNIASGILNDSEAVAGTLMSTSTPYMDIGLSPRVFDAKRAATLLDEAGWELNENGWRYKDGQRLSLVLSFNSDHAQERTIGESMQSDLQAVGVELELLGEETQAFFDRQRTGDFDLQYSLSWGLPYDPHTYISTWRVPSHGDYQAQLGLAEKKWLDETITEVLQELDTFRRQQLYTEIFTYIHNEAVYLPLTFSVVRAVSNDRLRGVGFNVNQYEIPFENMYFE